MVESEASSTRGRGLVAAGVAVLLGLATVGVISVIDETGGGAEEAVCPERETVSVRATPEMYDQAQAAASLVETSGEGCATFDVRRQPAGEVATSIESSNKAPDVWIPDSKVWVDNINELDGVQLKAGETLATSPVVMAVPKSLQSLEILQDDPGWADLLSDQLPVATADPNKTTSSLTAIIAANQAVGSEKEKTELLASYLTLSRSTTSEDVLYYSADGDKKTARIFPTSEQRLAAYNRSNPEADLDVVVPKEGAAQLTYTWVTPAKPTAPKEALTALRRQLTSPEGRSQMVQAGLRVPDAVPRGGTGVPKRVSTVAYPTMDESQGAQRAWVSLRKDARMLVLIDVSGSMIRPSGEDTRVGSLVKMADGAIDGLPKETSLGAWVFSTDLDGPGKDYRELVPKTKPLETPGYKAELRRELKTLPSLVERNGDTGLYDSVSAAYTHMTKTYDPEYVNSVVILTDGKNDDPGGGTDLTTLMAQLNRQYDPDKPVKVVSVAIGDDADPAALRKIAGPSNGLSYVASTPQEITSVFVDAFLRRGE